jgi:hypothetical protein
MSAPAAGELASLPEYLRYQHQAFDVTSYGLTDEQARGTPTASSLCIGGLIKHVTTMEYAWTQQVLAPAGLAQDPWSLEGMMVTWAHREEQFVMRDDDTLDGLLERLTAQNAATMGVLGDADLDASVMVLHLVQEFTRHAGHADIIRECIDGATMYELLAAVESWPESGPIKPWKPGNTSGASVEAHDSVPAPGSRRSGAAKR